MLQTFKNGSAASKQACFKQIGLDSDILDGFFLALAHSSYAMANVQSDIPEQAYHLLESGSGFRVRFGLQQKQQINIGIGEKQAASISAHRDQCGGCRHIAGAPYFPQYAVHQLSMLLQGSHSVRATKKLIG